MNSVAETGIRHKPMGNKKKPQENAIKAEQWDEFANELQSESERGLALLAAAFLDEHLRQLLETFMVDDQNAVSELLDSPNASLGSFSARIEASYCLGLISREMRDDLKQVRLIRNRFAHDLQGLSFADQQISQRCDNLSFVARLSDQDLGLPFASARDKFLIAVYQMASWIKLWALSASKHKRKVKGNVRLVR